MIIVTLRVKGNVYSLRGKKIFFLSVRANAVMGHLRSLLNKSVIHDWTAGQDTVIFSRGIDSSDRMSL